MIRLEMRSYNMTLTEKQQKYQHYHLEKKIDRYEYLAGEEILLSNQRQIIEPAKITYSPLGKAFQKEKKTNKDQGIKQIEAWKALTLKQDLKPLKALTLFRMEQSGRGGLKAPPYQFFPCNIYKRKN